MNDDLTRHVLERLPRRLSSRVAADDLGAAGSGEADRVVVAIAGRLGVQPFVIERALSGRRPGWTMTREG